MEPSLEGIPNNLNAFFSCDLDPTDAILVGSFDLESIRTENFPTNTDVAFFGSIDDAALELNPLSGTEFITQSTTIFVRLENANVCEGVEQFDLIVDPAPDIIFEDDVFLCRNLFSETIIGPDGFDIYRWFRIDTNGEILLGEGQEIEVFEPGTHRLEVGFIFSDNGVNRECTNSDIFEVISSETASFVDFIILDGSPIDNTIEVIVEGDGDYEFALDDINGPYQESNVFTNVRPGFVTVFVRDRNGCGIVDETISVIGFPQFFTPNNDGFNDFWQVAGVSNQIQADSSIFIFDRFGKLLSQIDPAGVGWDGTFNGRLLPSSTYWFNVTLEDGRNFTGHFVLKR